MVWICHYYAQLICVNTSLFLQTSVDKRAHTSLKNPVHLTIDVNNVFLRFLFRARFYVFLTFFFIFPTFFIFKNVHWKYHLKSLSKQWKQIGSVWLFFFVPTLEFPYRPIYWQALLFTYRIGLHQVTPLGVVFWFMLVNWWVEKHQRFFIQRLQTFLSRFLRFFNVFFIFFLERFFTSMHLTIFHDLNYFWSTVYYSNFCVKVISNLSPAAGSH